MSKATGSVLPVMPRIQGRLQCVNRLEPAMRLQQVNLQGLSRVSRPARCQRGPSLRFVPLRRSFLR
jgi:hypothetical protein